MSDTTPPDRKNLTRNDSPSSGGCYRRVIDLRTEGQGMVVGWMEDDFHHFGVTLIHDGSTITSLHAASPRFPWTTCPGALEAIKVLEGKPLVARASDIGKLVDMRSQCTHLFDLTGLALAHAANRHSHRRYEVEIPDRTVTWDSQGRPCGFGPTTATLTSEGTVLMAWDINEQEIVGPPAYAGHFLEAGFREWTETMPVDEAEYATILRRAILVGSGRLISMKEIKGADQLKNMGAVCFTFQPERRSQAHFIQSTRLDFAHRPHDLLKNVRDIP